MGVVGAFLRPVAWKLNQRRDISSWLPFCDGSHFFQHTGLSPLKFKAQETRTVALCTCKATQKPPYCDGTHRSERVQKAEVGSPL
uniref:MLLT6, PHD finger containing n=1 Tax=Molossus molossus TaxID=27622 RepID=A0A7J8D0B3_MOLMO|nr:MLLT6, PHD finger containing [Molossus molossus]